MLQAGQGGAPSPQKLPWWGESRLSLHPHRDGDGERGASREQALDHGSCAAQVSGAT